MLPHSILLSLRRKASHTVPLILYTNYDFTLSSVTMLTLKFSFSLNSLSRAQTNSLAYSFLQTQWTRYDLYTNISPKPSFQTDRSQSDRISTNKVNDIIVNMERRSFSDLVQLAFRNLREGSDGQTNNCIS